MHCAEQHAGFLPCSWEIRGIVGYGEQSWAHGETRYYIFLADNFPAPWNILWLLVHWYLRRPIWPLLFRADSGVSKTRSTRHCLLWCKQWTATPGPVPLRHSFLDVNRGCRLIRTTTTNIPVRRAVVMASRIASIWTHSLLRKYEPSIFSHGSSWPSF